MPIFLSRRSPVQPMLCGKVVREHDDAGNANVLTSGLLVNSRNSERRCILGEVLYLSQNYGACEQVRYIPWVGCSSSRAKADCLIFCWRTCFCASSSCCFSFSCTTVAWSCAELFQHFLRDCSIITIAIACQSCGIHNVTITKAMREASCPSRIKS